MKELFIMENLFEGIHGWTWCVPVFFFVCLAGMVVMAVRELWKRK